MLQDVAELKDPTLRAQVHALMNRMLTAPKARGYDDVRILYVDGAEKDRLAAAMREHGERVKRPGFLRDAGNLDRAAAIERVARQEQLHRPREAQLRDEDH